MIDELTASPIHIRALADLQLRLSKAHAYNATLLTLIAKMKETEESLRAEIFELKELEEELANQKRASEGVYTDRDVLK